MTAVSKRARTEDQKLFRRQQILSAAEAHFHEVGYESFSMAKLAAKAGVVKGTLYLYFQTREEVFLTLYGEALGRWSEYFIAQLREDMSDRDFAQTLYLTARQDPSFISLLTRLEQVIEHNVAMDSLIASKRFFIQRVERLAEKTMPVLDVNLQQATEIIKTMGILLVGSAGADQGPSLTQESVPDDVKDLVESFASDKIFVANACRIIHGIRIELN